MRAALALCALALAACAADDPALAAQRDQALCDNGLDPRESLLACSRVIEAESSTSVQRTTAMVRRGETHMLTGNYVRAIADFGRALRLQPSNTDALIQRGAAHFERGAFEAAGRDFDAVLAIAPAHADALQWRASAAEKIESAFVVQLANLDARIAAKPGDATLLNNRCWLRVTRGRDLDLALADCNESLRLEPANKHTLDSRGLVHYMRGDFEAALADYEAALAIEAGRGHYLYGRGLALQALGRLADAAAAFAAAEAAEPGVGALYQSYGAAPV